MRHYLHIAFAAHNASAKTEEIKAIVDKQALDWLRYAGNCWIVWTDKTAIEWFNLVEPLIDTSANTLDRVLIIKLDMSAMTRGYQPKWVWEWLNKQRY